MKMPINRMRAGIRLRLTVFAFRRMRIRVLLLLQILPKKISNFSRFMFNVLGIQILAEIFVLTCLWSSYLLYGFREVREWVANICTDLNWKFSLFTMENYTESMISIVRNIASAIFFFFFYGLSRIKCSKQSMIPLLFRDKENRYMSSVLTYTLWPIHDETRIKMKTR